MLKVQRVACFGSMEQERSLLQTTSPHRETLPRCECDINHSSLRLLAQQTGRILRVRSGYARP